MSALLGGGLNARLGVLNLLVVGYARQESRNSCCRFGNPLFAGDQVGPQGTSPYPRPPDASIRGGRSCRGWSRGGNHSHRSRQGGHRFLFPAVPGAGAAAVRERRPGTAGQGASCIPHCQSLLCDSGRGAGAGPRGADGPGSSGRRTVRGHPAR